MKKDKCYDIGVIQAFTDGELQSDLQEKVIGHIALCDACATLLAETEEESAFAFSVLDEELNVLVPTERLRTKVFASIKESKEKESWWSRAAASLGLADGFSFKSPSLVAFASVVLFVSALAIGVNFYNPLPTSGDIQVVDNSGAIDKTQIDFPRFSKDDVQVNDDRHLTPANIDVPRDTTADTRSPRQQNVSGFKVMNAGGTKNTSRQAKVVRTRNTTKPATKKPTAKPPVTPAPPAPSPNLSGEDSYLRTIATLSRTVDNNKDLTLRPTERVAFERDMAVVDDAIKKLKTEVRKNPKNKAAREVLRASYLNKIDLLNSVAEKSELMASIQ